MQFLSSKVVKIENGLYTSVEKIPSVSEEKNVVIMRKVLLTTTTYNHPISGKIEQKKFEKDRAASIRNGRSKVFISEQEWDAMEDLNTDNHRIDF